MIGSQNCTNNVKLNLLRLLSTELYTVGWTKTQKHLTAMSTFTLNTSI